MHSCKIDLQKISALLEERCPFIVFAVFTGLDDEGRITGREKVELLVYTDANTGTWFALEKILPIVAASVPETFCEVILLNRVDASTRFKAVQGVCLFVRKGKEQSYRRFEQHASLDHRIRQAHGRRRGIIDNE